MWPKSPKGGVSKMNKYEIMFIVRPDMEETEIKKVAKFVHEQNVRLSRQVAISVKVLQVEISCHRRFCW